MSALHRATYATLIATCIAVAAAPGIAAHNFPTKPVRMIVPFTPAAQPTFLHAGSPRRCDNWGQQYGGQPVAAGVGTLGAGIVAKATPDGYHAPVALHRLCDERGAVLEAPYDPLRTSRPSARF